MSSTTEVSSFSLEECLPIDLRAGGIARQKMLGKGLKLWNGKLISNGYLQTKNIDVFLANVFTKQEETIQVVEHPNIPIQ